jgi:FkbM family methyltransferase
MIVRDFRIAFSAFKVIWFDPSNRGQRIHRLIVSILWQVYKRAIGLPVILELDNGMKFIAEPRSGNSTGVIYTRIYESRYITFARKYVMPNGGLCDVGAHAGLYTLLLAPLFSYGLCFEPAADTRVLLERNLALNQLSSFSVRPEAVSSSIGQLSFLYSGGGFSGTAHLLREPETSSGQVEKVEVVTLDSILGDEGVNDLTYLKIDTEGHELEVFKGALLTLRLNPHALAHFECAPENRREVFALLSGLDWRVFELDRQGNPVWCSDVSATERDLLACGPSHPLSTAPKVQ